MLYSLNEKQQRISERNESFNILTLCVVLFLPALNNFANCFFQIGMGFEVPYLTEASYIPMLLFSFMAFLKSLVKDFSKLFISALIVGGCWLSYLIYPEIRTVLYDNPFDLVYNSINKVTFFCVPALVYTFQISDYKKLFETMVKWSKITLIVGVITFYYVYFVAGGVLQYMVFSYFMLTPICVCFESYLNGHKRFDLFLSLIGFFSILLCGARGAIISFLLYLIIRLITHKERNNTMVTILTVFSTVLACFLAVFFWENLLTWMFSVTEQLGIDSRFITSLINGTLNESSGRTSIANAIFSGIKANPFGYGLFGDRYVAGTFGHGSYTYAHNFALEMICSFGIVLGSIAIITFFYNLLKAMKKKSYHYNRVLWALIPYGVFQLFFSSSAIENVVFYMICAMIFSKKVKNDDEKNY